MVVEDGLYEKRDRWVISSSSQKQWSSKEQTTPVPIETSFHLIAVVKRKKDEAGIM